MNMPSPPPCWHRFPCFPLPLITNSALFPSECPKSPTVFGQLGYWWLMTREAFCIPKQHKLWLWTLETHSLSHAHASHSSDTLSRHADGACLKPAEQGLACQRLHMRVYQRHVQMHECVCLRMRVLRVFTWGTKKLTQANFFTVFIFNLLVTRPSANYPAPHRERERKKNNKIRDVCYITISPTGLLSLLTPSALPLQHSEGQR